MLAEELSGLGIEDPDRRCVPLDVDASAAAAKSLPNVLSLSRIKNRGARSYGVASRSRWATHAAVGDRAGQESPGAEEATPGPTS